MRFGARLLAIAAIGLVPLAVSAANQAGVVKIVDGKETKLQPGSYFAFTGMKQHLTKCEAGSDCTLFIDNRAKWDVIPEGDKAAPAKKK